MASWQKALPVTEQTASPGVCVALLLFEASSCGRSPLRGYHVGRSILLPQFSVPHLHPLRDRPALLLLPDSPFFLPSFSSWSFSSRPHPAPETCVLSRSGPPSRLSCISLSCHSAPFLLHLATGFPFPSTHLHDAGHVFFDANSIWR